MPNKTDFLDMPCSKQEHQQYIHQQLSELLTLIPKGCNTTKVNMEKEGEDIKMKHSYSGTASADLKTEHAVDTLSILYCLYLSYCKKYKQDKYLVQTENETRMAQALLVKNKNWDITIMIKMDEKDITPEIV